MSLLSIQKMPPPQRCGLSPPGRVGASPAAAVGHVMKRGLALCAPAATQRSLRAARQDKGGYCTGTGGHFHARNGGTGPVLAPPGGTGTNIGAFYIATAVLLGSYTW